MRLKQIADVNFPTRWADFRLLAFEKTNAGDGAKEERRENCTGVASRRYSWFSSRGAHSFSMHNGRRLSFFAV
ncbi:MAG TPA: hypothetical protein VGU67_02015 [Edaphobacter sp.]|nr:hypothetical protein [Edaphobacter sp.]